MDAARLDYRTLAAQVGVSHTYIWQIAGQSAIEGKRAKRPSRDVTIRLAEALGLDVEKALRAAGYSSEGVSAGSPGGIVKYTVLQPEAPALVRQGLDEARSGRFGRGAVLLREAVSRGGDISFVRAHTGLGVAYLGSKDFEAAVQEFDSAVSVYEREAHDGTMPHSIDEVDLADVLYNRGLAHQDLGDHQPAIADFETAIELGGNHPDLYFAGLCFSNLAIGRFKRVIRDALQYSAKARDDLRYTTASLDVRLYQAYAIARTGQYEAGLALADAVYVLCPDYWYSSFVSAGIAARFSAALKAKAARAQGAISASVESRAIAFEGLAMGKCEAVVKLNPNARETIRAEMEDDFATLVGNPQFLAVLGEAKSQGSEECA